MPFSSLFFSAVEVGPFPLQLQHSLGVCLLLPKENLASPGHTKPQGSRYCSAHPGGEEWEESRNPFLKGALTFQDVQSALSSTLGHRRTFQE